MEAAIGSSSFIASIFIFVSLFPVMDAVECFVLSNGHTVQFACGPNKACCGSQCCPAGGPFYTHWYFWLAVCMFLMVVLGFGISACRHFRKERKFQQCCARTKREIGADLLLNYHLMRTDLHHLPLYDEATAISQSHFGPLIYSPSTLPPPPPYSLDNDDDVNIGNTTAEHHNHPPPSYHQCVLQDESSTVLSLCGTDMTSQTGSQGLVAGPR